MVGIAVLVGASLLAIAFLGVFLAAICKERQHIKICMLLRQDPEDISAPDSWGEQIIDPLVRRSKVVAMTKKYRAVPFHEIRKPQPQVKIG
jgi:hypothetical protein